MQRLAYGIIAFVVIMLIGGIVGGMLLSYMFFGLIFFVSLVALTESIRPLRFIVYRLGSFFDIALTLGSIYVLFVGGVTAGAGITIGSLLFTIIYRPYIRYKRLVSNQRSKDITRFHIKK